MPLNVRNLDPAACGDIDTALEKCQVRLVLVADLLVIAIVVNDNNVKELR